MKLAAGVVDSVFSGTFCSRTSKNMSLLDWQADELERFLSSPADPARNLLCLADAALAYDGQGGQGLASGGDDIIAGSPDSRRPWSELQHAPLQQTAEHSGVREEPSAATNRHGAALQRAAEYSGPKAEPSGAANELGSRNSLGGTAENGSICLPRKLFPRVHDDREENGTKRDCSEYVRETRRNRQPRRIRTDSSSEEDVVSAWGREGPERHRGEHRTARRQETTNVKFRTGEREMKDIHDRTVSRSCRRSHVWSDSEDERLVRSDEDSSPSKVRRRDVRRSNSRERTKRSGKNFHSSGVLVITLAPSWERIMEVPVWKRSSRSSRIVLSTSGGIRKINCFTLGVAWKARQVKYCGRLENIPQ